MTLQHHTSAPQGAESNVQAITGKAHSWLYRLAAEAKERTAALGQSPQQAQVPDLDQRVRQVGEW
jgi:hypothetical protein